MVVVLSYSSCNIHNLASIVTDNGVWNVRHIGSGLWFFVQTSVKLFIITSVSEFTDSLE